VGLNRPFQARFAETLIEISGLSTTSSRTRKCVRPSEILKSNKMVENILNALNTQFLNRFWRRHWQVEVIELSIWLPSRWWD
jgi:hypothetical protein